MKAPGSDPSYHNDELPDRHVKMLPDRNEKLCDHDVKIEADRETKIEGWKLDQLEWGYHWKQLKELLIRDPVLKILKPKLIGSLQGPILAPIATSNQLEAIRHLMNLLQEAGFAAGAFDAQILLEFSADQVIQASRLFSRSWPH